MKRTPFKPKIQPGVYWFNLDGWRLGLLSYAKRGKVAIVETFYGKERIKPDDLNVVEAEPDTVRRFKEKLSER